MTTSELTYSGQNGTPGHCFQAQVWGQDGVTLAVIEPTADPATATGYARMFAASPFMLAALKHARQNMAHPDQMIDDAIAAAES